MRDDVRPDIAAADCVVLPSYREGLSRSLLEAAAMGRPLVASDVPGCREVIDDGVTGFLCDVRSAASLAAAMERIAAMSPADRMVMGAAGRLKVAAEFDQKLVAEAYLAEVDPAPGGAMSAMLSFWQKAPATWQRRGHSRGSASMRSAMSMDETIC